MNEKIRELAVESGFATGYDRTQTGKWSLSDRELEKFAELIVKECAEQIVAKGTDWVDFAPSQTGVRPEYWAMAQQIKQHFGVEE